jgi:hypothetical protein
VLVLVDVIEVVVVLVVVVGFSSGTSEIPAT